MSMSGHGQIIPADRPRPIGIRSIDVRSTFDYLFREVVDLADAQNFLPAASSAETTANLVALARAMADTSSPHSDNATMPVIYTYWGQFIDHDITLQARDPCAPEIDPADTVPLAPATLVGKGGARFNRRRPALDLDSMYGDGPRDPGNTRVPEAADFYNADFTFKLGELFFAETIPGVRVPPQDDVLRDLRRSTNGAPRIGDLRNDENLVVAQLHVAFLRFHNAVLDWVQRNSKLRGFAAFQEARRLVRSHYQWLVLHDYLKTVARADVVDEVLAKGPRLYTTSGSEAFMPCEFSDAAFRFGHSMVRNGYDHNRNFGRNGVVKPVATLEDLFRFTGAGGFRPGGPAVPGNPAAPNLPFNWAIEWDRFTDRDPASVTRKARKFDTRLAPAVLAMFNEGEAPDLMPPLKEMLKHLAMRNLLRGYLFSIPTAQAMVRGLQAKGADIAEMSEAELKHDNAADTNAVLDRAGFVTRTPAWYYILKEAEVRQNGERLGQLGSHILAETFVGLLLRDPHSILNTKWTPAAGVKDAAGNEVRLIEDLLTFAGVMPRDESMLASV